MASTPEPIELCMALYQGLYVELVSVMSPKCSIVRNDGELMLMALHTHFLPQQQYSRVYVLSLAFQALVYRWGYKTYGANGASFLPKSVRSFRAHSATLP